MKARAAYSFRPGPWALLLTLLLSAAMVKAGFWQYGRGAQKQLMQAARAAESQTRPQPLLDDVSAPPAGLQRRVMIDGIYAPELGVELDNQSHQQQAGVHAWTPLTLASGQRVIVDRGWLPLDTAVTPPPAGLQHIEGDWKRLPVPALRLGDASAGCKSTRPVRVNYPGLAQVRCLFGASTLDGVLELSAGSDGGFTRDWALAGTNEIPPSRHFIYAAQWWLFATTLVALFIKIHLKKIAAHD